MQYKNAKLSALLFLCMGLLGLHAQEVVPAAGGDASGSGGTVSYSVGQANYITANGSNGSVAPGVQQPYEISVVSGIDQAIGIGLLCSVYPNPSTDVVTLNVENFDNVNLSYQLYDIGGQLLENKLITGNETTIVMKYMLPATYFLIVYQNNNEIKTFKIIKN